MHATRLLLLGITLVMVGLLVGCGGNEGGPSTGSGNKFTIGTVGDERRFDADGIILTAGEQVAITVKNNAANGQCNWVLVKGGEDVAQQVVEAAILADSPKGYIPDDKTNIVANSRLLEAGESEVVTFTAPAPGTYVYLSTFPGHYEAGMKGALVVK